LVCLLKNQIDEPAHPFGSLSGDAVKIAVVALVETKGDVDVESLNLTCGEVVGVKLRRG
jgi:hypothetical protein